jgi:hypothetical protein
MKHTYWIHYDRTVNPSHQNLVNIQDHDVSTTEENLVVFVHSAMLGNVEEHTTPLPSYFPGSFGQHNPAEGGKDSTRIKYLP